LTFRPIASDASSKTVAIVLITASSFYPQGVVFRQRVLSLRTRFRVASLELQRAGLPGPIKANSEQADEA